MRLAYLIAAMALSGCSVIWPEPPARTDGAICDGTRQSRADHAAALIDDGGLKSQRTGATLLVQMRDGCAE